jgi:hypothetical protein
MRCRFDSYTARQFDKYISMQHKPGSIFEAASSVLFENPTERLARMRLEIQKGKEYASQYEALISSLAKVIPWTKKPTKSKSSALIEYTGEIGVNQLSFSWHAIDNRYSYGYAFMGALISEAGKYGKIHEFGPKLDIIGMDVTNDDHIKKNLEAFKKTIELAKKIDPKKLYIK